MSSDLLEAIKMVAVAAGEAGKPVKVVFGDVMKANPLEIMVEQKILLTEEYLILTDAVRDHWRDMTVDHLTENRAGGSGDRAYESHNHEYKGRKAFLIHNDLVAGEKVVLLAMQGGQKFVVLDRV